MVSVMRVCREWLETIDDNRALWRELILPEKKTDPGLKSLEFFDRKSGSTLTQVSMNVAEVRERTDFIKILEKSKATLQVLNLTGLDYDLKKKVFWDYPKLIDCRLFSLQWRTVQINLTSRGKEAGAQIDPGSSLKVLWVCDSENLLRSRSQMFNGLLSLYVIGGHSSSSWRRFLEVPSRTLRHLELTFKGDHDQSISALEFPFLEILDLHYTRSSLTRRFPGWIKAPKSATFITHTVDLLSSLPSCSKLWINHISNVNELQARCPELSELRLNTNYPETFNSEDCNKLISMLRQRKSNVEAGTEIDGARMIPLKTLVLPFRLVKDEFLSLLRELVEEVVDLESVSSFIELEI